MASSAYQNATPADQSLYQTALSQAKAQLATNQTDDTSALDNFQRVINQLEHPSHPVYSHSASQAKDHLSSASMGVTGAVMTAAVGVARLKQVKDN
ncbi:hypothetical protein [Ligilactobacillus agilis]|uniref:hypothetical protein n=1 Tax=Ligilactobacillus agilis TaxID=1601 RepID=UPI00195A306B|nr:hypothetical protein [Ligilactobacillus agilis]MBM6763860.1 hypothetical protein [Ligilactobacillus agilis]